jgi:hypothetical protein
METIFAEERELCLALLAERCFLRKPDGSYILRSVEEFIRPQHAADDGVHHKLISGGRSLDVDTEMLSAAENALHASDSPRPPPRVSEAREEGTDPAEVLSAVVEVLDAAMDPDLAKAQRRRCDLETRDKFVELSAPRWRGILRQKRKEKLQRSSHSIEHAPLPRSVYERSEAFSLERVLLQRISKRLVAEGADATAVTRAAMIEHAAKRAIPPEYLHRLTKIHPQVVQRFKETVEAVLPSPPDEFRALTSAFAPSVADTPVPRYARPVDREQRPKSSPGIGALFVHRQRTPDVGDGRRSMTDAQGKRGEAIESHETLITTLSHNSSSHVGSSHSSRIHQRRDTLFVSPFMYKGALPVSNPCFTGKVVKR